MKILEKNFTAQQSNLRSLETISGQTNADVKKILKSLVKADESFKEGFGTDFLGLLGTDGLTENHTRSRTYINIQLH